MSFVFKTIFIFVLFFLLAYLLGYSAQPPTLLQRSVFNGLGDEVLAVWIFEKLNSNLFKHPLFDGGIFFPSQNTLAFVENMLIPALFYKTFRLFFDNFLLAYHSTVLFLLSLNGLSMWIFLRRWLSPLSCFTASYIFSLGLYRMGQLNHVQLLPQMFFPLVALFVFLYEKRSHRFLWIPISLLVSAQIYSSIHLGLQLVLCLIFYSAIRTYLKKDKKERTLFFVDGFFCCLLIGLICYPLANVYLKVSKDNLVFRTLEDAKAFSANPLSYFWAPSGSLWHSVTKLFQITSHAQEKNLFMGIGVFFLVYLVLKEKLSPLYWKKVLIVLTILIIWLSFGPNGGLYTVFYHGLVFLKTFRVPARLCFSLLFIFSIAVGFGFQILEKTKNKLWLGIFIIFLGIENYVRTPFIELPVELKKVTSFLSLLPDKEPILHLPIETSLVSFQNDNGNSMNNREAVRMYYSLFHKHPLFNGYAGFEPLHYQELKALERTRSELPKLLDYIKKFRIKYIVLENIVFSKENPSHLSGLSKLLPTLYEDSSCRVLKVSD